MPVSSWGEVLKHPGLKGAAFEMRQRDTSFAARVVSAEMEDGLLEIKLEDLKFVQGGEAYVQGCSVTELTLKIKPILALPCWNRASRWEFDLPLFQFCAITPKPTLAAIAEGGGCGT